jgi:diguanylate cyclase (GGDEF)-like protein
MITSQQGASSSLGRKLFYSHLSCALAVCFAVGAYLLWSMQADARRITQERLSASHARVEEAIRQNSAEQLGSELQRLARSEKLANLTVTRGHEIVFSLTANEVAESVIATSASLDTDPNVRIALSIDSSAQNARFIEVRNHALLGFVGAVLASLLFAQLLANRAKAMLTPLLDRFDQLAQGNFEARLPTGNSNDVFSRLAMGFNEMGEKLQRSLKERERTTEQLKFARDQLESSVRDRTLELNNLNDMLRVEHEQRAQLEASLAEAAATDGLTKLLNRRAMLEILKEVQAELKKQGKSCCIAILDIDHFKQVNDRFGHDVGDQVLVGVGKVIRDHLGHREAAARWGGEEFIIAWPNQVLKVAEQRADRLRGLLEDCAFANGKLTVTASFGLAEWHPDENLQDALHRADQALYRAKAEGRNRVKIAQNA